MRPAGRGMLDSLYFKYPAFPARRVPGNETGREDCTVAIGKRLVGLLEPHFLRMGGYWYPRGGMPIDVFWQNGEPPKGVWLPDQGVPPYRGRG